MPNTTMRRCAGLLATLLLAVGLGAAEADYPPSLTISSGKLEFTFGATSMYNIVSVKYAGASIKGGGHEGTVFALPGIGWSGTGHTEKGEKESDFELNIVCDGIELDPKALDGGKRNVRGKEVMFEKKSKVRGFTLHQTFTLAGDTMVQRTVISAAEDVPLTFYYNFMSSWNNKFDQFRRENDQGEKDTGAFTDDNSLPPQNLRWYCFYNQERKLAIVMKVQEASDLMKNDYLVWDRKDNNKYYLRCTPADKKFPGGREAAYQMTTRFVEADADGWQAAAEKVAEAIPTL